MTEKKKYQTPCITTEVAPSVYGKALCDSGTNANGACNTGIGFLDICSTGGTPVGLCLSGTWVGQTSDCGGGASPKFVAIS